MEAIEFYVWEGKVRYRLDGEERILKQNDREIIEFVLENLRTFFPEALNALSEECKGSAANKLYYEFRIVDLFIRCNFAEHDTLNFDVANGFMHFEEVKCPRRGICKNEGKICKPKMKMSITGYYFIKCQSKDSAKQKAEQIMILLNQIVEDFIMTANERGD